MSQRERHPLAGAEARIARAGEHLNDIKRRIAALEEATTERLPADPNDPATVRTQHTNPEGPLDGISLILGEVIHNLRAALDYLVYELAVLDSGAEQDGTQFLIEDTEDGFQRNTGRRLKGLSAEHVTAMEALQPYKGVEWTKELRDLSNPDKHRKLHIVRGQHFFDLGNLFTVIPAAEAGTDTDVMQVNLGMALHVTLPNGGYVVETLEVLQRQVADLIQAFKPEFKRG